MTQRIDPRHFNNLIDANILDRLNGPEDAVVDEIIALADSGRITLQLPHSVKAEIDHPDAPADVKRQAVGFIYTSPVSLTAAERQRHEEVHALVRGNAEPGEHDRDAYHMVEAARYGGYFITRDARLLEKRIDVAGLLGAGFAIVTPSEFLEAYEHYERQP